MLWHTMRNVSEHFPMFTNARGRAGHLTRTRFRWPSNMSPRCKIPPHRTLFVAPSDAKALASWGEKDFTLKGKSEIDVVVNGSRWRLNFWLEVCPKSSASSQINPDTNTEAVLALFCPSELENQRNEKAMFSVSHEWLLTYGQCLRRIFFHSGEKYSKWKLGGWFRRQEIGKSKRQSWSTQFLLVVKEKNTDFLVSDERVCDKGNETFEPPIEWQFSWRSLITLTGALLVKDGKAKHPASK